MMKDPDRIVNLLEAYYQGQTSLVEEEELREYFRSGDFPVELSADAEMFGFFSNERSAPVIMELEDKITRALKARKPAPENVFTRWRTYWVGGVAAGILILISIFIDIRIKNVDQYIVQKDTYEDPYMAYTEAKKVLSYVSGKMNTGTEPLKNLNKMDASLNYMTPVFSFGPGIQRLEYLNAIDKTKELISK